MPVYLFNCAFLCGVVPRENTLHPAYELRPFPVLFVSEAFELGILCAWAARARNVS